MSGTDNTSGNESTTESEAVTEATDATAESETDTGNGGNSADELPEWARKELTSTRAEAANYRTKLREAEKKLGEAKTPEEFQKAVDELKAQNEALERSALRDRVARKFSLPDDLAEVLTGDDENAVTEHAKRLQKYAVTAPLGDLRGGLDPNDDDTDPDDPRALARKYGGRRRG